MVAPVAEASGEDSTDPFDLDSLLDSLSEELAPAAAAED
jgi:hypothetical protein